MRTDWPFSVLTELRFATFAAVRLPFATWYSKTARSFALSLPSAFNVDRGTLANAASVGAKTVYGPFAWSALASPAFFTSDVSVLNFPAATAVSTMFFVGLAAGAAGWAPARS